MMMTCARFISKESLIVYTHNQGWWDNNADSNDNKTENEKKMTGYMQHLCVRLINPLSRLVKQSKRSLQIILVVLHLSNDIIDNFSVISMTREISINIMLTMTMMLMMLTYLELDVSKGVIVDEPVISNTMTLHLHSGVGPMQITPNPLHCHR